MRPPPAVLRWVVRRMHNGINRWTQRRIVGLDGRYGWSAWSHVMARRGYRPAMRAERAIDALFGAGHCKADYERIVAGRDLIVTWREVFAAAVLLAPWALAAAALALAL